MGLKQMLARIVPPRKESRLQRESKQLNAIPTLTCTTGALRNRSALVLGDIFNAPEIDSAWQAAEVALRQFDVPDGTGGVNPGDRRAIYYLISAIKPVTVLEIGTHIGASTLHIAAALKKNGDKAAKLTTVDINDVNSRRDQRWRKYGASYSPQEMISKLGCSDLVEFIADTSLNYAARCQQTFDFIFLDGDHSADTVYRELPVALSMLNPDGVILLHDFFPDAKPLWSNGSVIPGPFLATERLRREGADISVLPLGGLPWPTKLGSSTTSLALLLRTG